MQNEKDFFDLIDELEAEEVCGRATIIVGNRLKRLFCGRFRSCPKCRDFRILRWERRLRRAMEKTEGDWFYMEFDHGKAKEVRLMLSSYFSFPTDRGTVIVSPALSEGESFDESNLHDLCVEWIMTPEGMRPSRSRNFVPQRPKREKYSGPTYLVGASPEEVSRDIEKLGGSTAPLQNGDIEFINCDQLNLILFLLLRGKTVKKIANSDIIILTPNDTIFEKIPIGPLLKLAKA